MTSVADVTGAVRPIFDGSEMGRLMAALDWESTLLGAPENWPEPLRTTVSMMLASKQQIAIFWGPQYVALYNDAYFPMIGSKHPGALGRPVRERWGEVLHVLLPLLDKVVESGEAFWARDHPFPIVRHGCLERVYCDVSYDPVRLADGHVGGVLCLVTETTGRVLSQRRIRTLSELGTATTGVQQVDRVVHEVITVLAGNPDDLPFAQIYLGEPGRLHRVASTVGEQDGGPRIIVPGDGTPAASVAVQVLGAGQPVSAPAAGFLKPGTRLAAEVVLALPITSAAGVEGMLVAGVNPMFPLPGSYREFYDVLSSNVSSGIANALAHEQERRRLAALAELDRAKTEFFANVSHEFRTPLTLIAGPAEDALADRVEPLPVAQRGRLEIVRRNAGRLRRLVDDLLDVARIEGGRLQPETVAVDLAELTRGIAESFAQAVERAGLAMRIDCPPLGRTVVVDLDMWERILLNLLSNALKYTHQGQITVALRPRGDEVELVVTDTGLGIPADQLPLLFQRFHRVRGAAGRTHEGAGIGLALVHELAGLLDGAVSVDSCVGQGSTFTVRLPFARAATTLGAPKRTSMVPFYLEEALHWTQPSQPPAPPTASFDEAVRPSTEVAAGALVVVVEDNADMRAYLTTLLAQHYTVIGTADGQAALREITAYRPDLVLADVMMPALDGFGLLAALRGDPQTAAIPVILLSARAGAEAAVDGLAAGADDYLIKPFSARDLLARVRSNLELARLRNHESAWRVALVNALQDGFIVTTTDGTVIEMNQAFGMMFGYGPEGLPYHVPNPWWPDPVQDPDDFQQVNTAFTVIQTKGEGRFVLPTRHRDGHRIWAAVAVASVRDREGQRQLFVATVRDVTAEYLAAGRQITLTRFAERLSQLSGVREVLDVGVAEFRDKWGAQRVVAISWDGDQIELITGELSWAALGPDVRAAITVARRTGCPQTPTDLPGIAVPVETGARPMVFWLDLDHWDPPGGEDRLLLTGLCEQLAQVLTRARAFDEHRAVAITLQRAILGPTDLPPGFAVRYEPAASQLEIGGDWYDVVSLAEDCVGVVVGDCVGRGLGAAAVMGQLRSACRALLLQAPRSPGQVLAALDDFAALIPDARCSTVFCATITLSSGSIRYSSAGHLPGLLVHADGHSETLDAAKSVPLAVMGSARRPEATATLQAGSTLLLYTDGLIERRQESLADGISRLSSTLIEARRRAPEPLAAGLAKNLLGAGHEDDVAYVIYQHPRWTPFTAVFPADPGRLSLLRTALHAWLATSFATRRAIEEIVLAVSEACTNTIEHASCADPYCAFTIAGTVTAEAIEVVISDNGRWKPPRSQPGGCGRGFVLMELLMDDVTVITGEPGTTVRLRKEL